MDVLLTFLCIVLLDFVDNLEGIYRWFSSSDDEVVLVMFELRIYIESTSAIVKSANKIKLALSFKILHKKNFLDMYQLPNLFEFIVIVALTTSGHKEKNGSVAYTFNKHKTVNQ